MTDYIQESEKNSLTGRLKELLTDISPFIDNASKDQKRKLLSVLDDLRKTNRRKHYRKPCSITVNYSIWGDAFNGLVKDISAGGMFILSIETDLEFSVGQEITVNFPTHTKKQESIKFPGKVAWIVPKGIGVKFKAEDQNLESIIESL